MNVLFELNDATITHTSGYTTQYYASSGLSFVSIVAKSPNHQLNITLQHSVDGKYINYSEAVISVAGNGKSSSYGLKAQFFRFLFIGNTNTCTQVYVCATTNESPQSITNLSNVGSGIELYKPNQLQIRTVQSSDSSILLTQDADTIDIRTFANSVGIQSTGSTYSLLYDDVGPVFLTKTLNATNCQIIDDGTNLLISADVVNLGSTGGNSLVSDGIGPILSIKGIEAGSFINIIPSDTTIMINGLESSTYLTTILSSLGGITLVSSGIGPNLSIRGLEAGSFINIVSSNTTLQINGLESYQTTVLSSIGGGNSLVSDGIGPNIEIKGLIPGSGIILTSTLTNITITSGADFNTAYGGIKSNITNILSIYPNTSILLVPNYTSFVSYNMTAINAQLRYLEDVPRVIGVEFDMDIYPTDIVNNLSFSLCKNQTNILDTRKCFTLGSYEHISLQALTSMAKNDNIGIYMSHNNVLSTIVQTMTPYYSFIATHQQFASESYNTNGQYNIPAQGTTPGQYLILNWTVIISPHPNIIFTAPGQYFTVGSTFNATINFTTTIGQLTFLRIIKNSIVVYSQGSNANFSTSMALVAGDILYMDLGRGAGNSTGNFNITFIS